MHKEVLLWGDGMSDVNCNWEAECEALRYELNKARDECADLNIELDRRRQEADFMRGKIEAYEYVLKIQGGRK